MTIWYPIEVDEVPESCAKCPCQWCSLPWKKSSYEPTIKTRYMTKRHEDCPLMTDEEVMQKISGK